MQAFFPRHQVPWWPYQHLAHAWLLGESEVKEGQQSFLFFFRLETNKYTTGAQLTLPAHIHSL